jgi:hypothetical protein
LATLASILTAALPAPGAGVVHVAPGALRVEKASHVVIRGLEIRWFQEAGVSVIDSPSVSVCECRLWNEDSPGWVNGAGLVARRSPGFVADRNQPPRMPKSWIFSQPPMIREIQGQSAGIAHAYVLGLQRRNAGAMISPGLRDASAENIRR